MAGTCRIDCTSSPTFRAQFKDFRKKHPSLESDLTAALLNVAADYQNACNASRVSRRSPKDPPEIYKYEIGCTDLNRSARNAFRMIGVFLEPESTEPGQERTLYLVLWYWKGDESDYATKELLQSVKRLSDSLAAPTDDID